MNSLTTGYMTDKINDRYSLPTHSLSQTDPVYSMQTGIIADAKHVLKMLHTKNVSTGSFHTYIHVRNDVNDDTSHVWKT